MMHSNYGVLLYVKVNGLDIEVKTSVLYSCGRSAMVEGWRLLAKRSSGAGTFERLMEM